MVSKRRLVTTALYTIVHCGQCRNDEHNQAHGSSCNENSISPTKAENYNADHYSNPIKITNINNFQIVKHKKLKGDRVA